MDHIYFIGPHAICYEGIKKLFAKIIPDCTIVNIETLDAAIQSVEQMKGTSCIIIDFDISFAAFLKLWQQASLVADPVKLIILADEEDISYLSRLMQMKVSGILDKAEKLEYMHAGCMKILQGLFYISHSLYEMMLNRQITQPGYTIVNTLTDIEFLVADQLYRSSNLKEIANRLSLNYSMVSGIKKKIFAKLNLKESSYADYIHFITHCQLFTDQQMYENKYLAKFRTIPHL